MSDVRGQGSLFAGMGPKRGVAMLSGGASSWRAAKVWKAKNPDADLLLMFTDVLFEDADTYRFLLEGAANIFDRKLNWLPRAEDFPDYRVLDGTPIEEYRGNSEWRAFLADLREKAAIAIPELQWLVEGRDPWEVYRDERYLGNSRKDPCSKILKRKQADKWLAEHGDPDRDVLIYGIGEHEKHRFDDGDGKGILHRLASKGFRCEAPLIGMPEINPILHVRAQGIEPARNYALNYMHDNCGGFCCKGGKAHVENRNAVHPERADYDAMMEAQMQRFLGKPYTILTETVRKVKFNLSMAAFLLRLRADPELHHEYEPGDSGCGCMVDEDDEPMEIAA